MISAELFHELHYAYFTVTVQQSTIDQWRIHGGRTTFMARGTNANKVSVRLAPLVGVIDGTTGKPAGRPPHISTGDHQQLSSIGDLTAETSSRWRLPVLIFCGKDDEGMSLEDEEYLGRPLEHGEACVVLSENWVIDSVAAGRLLRMADYAKHASPCVDVDLPSLFLPSPFPPTYRIALAHLQDMSANLPSTLHEENLRGIEGKPDHIRNEGPVLQVLGPFPLSDDRQTSGIVRPPGHIEADKHDSQQDERFIRSRTVPDSGRAQATTDQTMTSETLPFLCSRESYLHSSQTEGFTNRVRQEYNACDRPKSLSSLESYICAKKQSHIKRIEEELSTWIKKERERADMDEEARIDMELDEGSEKRIDTMALKINEHGPKVTGKHTSGLTADPEAAMNPLELEASMLLKLLPLLKISRLPGIEAEANDNLRRFIPAKNLASIVPYYPYLTAVPSNDSNPTAISHSSGEYAPQPSGTLGDSRHATQLPACRKITPGPLSQKRVIAFHSAGYGVGWMDFEACTDWVCVPKQKKSTE